MSTSDRIQLRFTGDYALADSVALGTRAAFVSGMRTASAGRPPILDLVFPVEGPWDTIGVTVHQTDVGVFADVVANPGKVSTSDIRDRLEHILALDVDGEGFRTLAQSDPVVAGLQTERRGVRPVLFPSPYEAAARAIIGQRLHVRQAAALHARIAADHGVPCEIAGATMHGFPAPGKLADLTPVQGLSETKTTQLRALGTAAAEGWLDTARLQAMPQDAAMKHLQELAGIGPFSAELILIRGVGDPDAFPATEMRLQRAMAQAYGLGSDPDLATLRRIADGWRPYRSWVGLLLRNHGA